MLFLERAYEDLADRRATDPRAGPVVDSLDALAPIAPATYEFDSHAISGGLAGPWVLGIVPKGGATAESGFKKVLGYRKSLADSIRELRNFLAPPPGVARGLDPAAMAELEKALGSFDFTTDDGRRLVEKRLEQVLSEQTKLLKEYDRKWAVLPAVRQAASKYMQIVME